MNTNSDTNSKKTIINSISLATCMSFVYIIIFIALMLVSNKIIQVDTVALPAIFIFLVISGIEFVFAKLKRNVPQVFNIIFFIIVIIIAIIIAIAMTIIL